MLFSSFFGAQSLGYLVVCLMRGDAFFQLFGIWYSTQLLMWSTGVFAVVPLLTGLSHWILRNPRAIRHGYSNDTLLRRWVGLQTDGVLTRRDVSVARRIHGTKL